MSIMVLFAVSQLLLVSSTVIKPPYLLSAPWTPFKEDRSVDYEKIDRQMEIHALNQVTHVWASGGMAQWDQLTVEERKMLAVQYVKACKKYGLYSIIHVGHQTIATAMELAAYAESIGADSIAVLPPFAPERPNDIEGLIEIMGLIANAAPSLPFFYYHIPGTTNFYYSMAEFIEKSRSVIPTLAGIKYVESNLIDFENCAKAKCTYKGCDNGKYFLFWANNPKIQSIPFGANGFTLAENYYARFTKEMYESYFKNQTRAMEITDKIEMFGKIISKASGKSVMKMMGLDLGPPRLPQYPVSDEKYTQACLELSRTDFFNPAITKTPNCRP